uniref:PTB domain-containing engulfment adapter protein 1-like n=1 Tax=Hirondellea gigas TaxID=1518452 RepID=A0A2P2I576_9CRUS
MMKNSGLLRWTNNKNATNRGGQNGNKNWLHPAETLQKGHIAYLVKFLGSTEVDQPKGFDVVKDAIQKLSFSQQLRKAEGVRTPKVELTISVDGVAIHEPKTKRNLHQYPLHRISYCADDKAEKRFFSFIAKEADGDKHTCYVFVSDKLAEEITLTIGQAFDLAYRRFLETSGKELELRRQVSTLQNKLKVAESENALLRQQLSNLNGGSLPPSTLICDNDTSLSDGLVELGGESSTDPAESSQGSGSPQPLPGLPPLPPRTSSHQIDDLLDDSANDDDTDDSDFNPRAVDDLDDPFSPLESNGLSIMPTTNGNSNHKQNGLEDDFNPRAEEPRVVSTPSPLTNNSSSPPPLIPPPRPSRPHETQMKQSVEDMLGSVAADPFNGGPTINMHNNNDDLLAQFTEMKAGFSRGLSFGTADQDFTLESLDPLKN